MIRLDHVVAIGLWVVVVVRWVTHGVMMIRLLLVLVMIRHAATVYLTALMSISSLILIIVIISMMLHKR